MDRSLTERAASFLALAENERVIREMRERREFVPWEMWDRHLGFVAASWHDTPALVFDLHTEVERLRANFSAMADGFEAQGQPVTADAIRRLRDGSPPPSGQEA